jgi:hypothetical protein
MSPAANCRQLLRCFSLADFLPWKQRQHVPPKRWFSQDLHGAKFQKTALFINIRYSYIFYRNKFKWLWRCVDHSGLLNVRALPTVRHSKVHNVSGLDLLPSSCETVGEPTVWLRYERTNSVALSPRAYYTDWATATCRRNLVSTFVDRGCRVVSAADPLRSLISVFLA